MQAIQYGLGQYPAEPAPDFREGQSQSSGLP